MSNIYIQEPPSNGKVILHTTVGPIDIELWPKEAPKACRNFVQLSLEGYYDGTIFHRLIKGMCVQGGDPTGTGEGGESIYGKPFKDEFHSRLRFVRRGLVAMASGGKDDNTSQFFFTLGPTPHLNNKHTIFGKVVGDTIYNMLKLEEGDVDDDDRPEFPQKVKRTEVVDNPFPDIVPRKKERKDERAEKPKKPKEKVKKDFKLLSFGDEAEEEDEELTEIVEKQYRGKSKSSHDLLKDDKTLSSAPAVETPAADDVVEKEASKSVDMKAIRDKLKEKSKQKEKKNEKRKNDSDDDGDVNVENYFDEERKRKAKKQIDEIRNEYKKIKKEMKESDKKKTEEQQPETSTADHKKDAGNNDLLASFYAEQDAYSAVTTSRLKKGEKNSREAQTLAMLEKFKAKLQSSKNDDGEKNDEPSKDNWLRHELRFDDQTPVLAKDANTQKDEMYDITDPRHPLNQRKRKESSKSHRSHRR